MGARVYRLISESWHASPPPPSESGLSGRPLGCGNSPMTLFLLNDSRGFMGCFWPQLSGTSRGGGRAASCLLNPVVPASPGKITRLFDVGSWNSSQLIKTAECLNTWKVSGTSLPAHAGVRQTEALRGAVGWRRQTHGSIFSWTNAPDSPASESFNLRTNCGNEMTSLISVLHLSRLKAAPWWGGEGEGQTGHQGFCVTSELGNCHD